MVRRAKTDFVRSTCARVLLLASLGFTRLQVGAEEPPPASRTPPTVRVRSEEAADSYNDGVALLSRNRPAEAAERFRRAIRYAPGFAEAHANLGAALWKLGDMQGAQSELERAIALDPSCSPAWATLGSCYQMQGQLPKAVEAWKRYLQLDPNGELAPEVRGMVTIVEQELQRAGGAPVDSPDYLADAVIAGLARWSTTPVRVFIKSGEGVAGYQDAYPGILREAFADWEEASRGKLRFQYVDDVRRAQIICSWTASTSDLVSTVEGGHAVIVPNEKGGITSATITLLTRPEPDREPTAGYLRRIDLHEVGHALGIMGHSKNPADVMFMSMSPDTGQVSLSERDRSTLVALYSGAAEKVSHSRFDPSKLIVGDADSRLNRVLTLNNDAKTDMEKGDLAAAEEKLEAALALEPDNPVVCGNLGAVYGRMAAEAFKARRLAQTAAFLERSIPLLERGVDKNNLVMMLENYALVLRATHREQEARKIDARLRTLRAN